MKIKFVIAKGFALPEIAVPGAGSSKPERGSDEHMIDFVKRWGEYVFQTPQSAKHSLGMHVQSTTNPKFNGRFRASSDHVQNLAKATYHYEYEPS